MSSNTISENTYFTIQGWMVSKLGLSGNELLCYAIIYGFSQDGSSVFKGSRAWLASWLSSSLPTVDRALVELIGKGLLEKNQETTNGVTFNYYKALIPDFIGSKKTLQGGSKETLHDNNTIDNNKEEGTNVPPKKNDYQAIVDCWNEYNGAKLGKVMKLTERRKKSIKRVMGDNEITQEQLMAFFKALPYADSWLYNPNKQHKNWKPDFDWWMANTNGWLTKALEGKVHNENPQAFASIVRGDELGEMPYTPQTDGNIHWNDYYKCYIFIGMFRGEVTDGYTDDNRPNGATLMLNNGAGTVKWNKEGKSWIKL